MLNTMLLRKKVYSICRPGEYPREGLAAREGFVIGINISKWGNGWIVKWNDGTRETVDNISPVSEFRGIGVYYDDHQSPLQEVANNEDNN